MNRYLVYDWITTIEDDRNPIIALNIGFHKKKRVKVIGYYQQFQSQRKNEKKITRENYWNSKKFVKT